jgi:demethylmenaquinone methyltransferase/2-methoxy-6-polyprenyl-1,4-benzoquinol methylase
MSTKPSSLQTDTSLIDYYAKRANEYERIYQKPERQEDLATIKKLCAQTLAGQTVLEVACGTGYWTQPVSQTAHSILATDVNEEVLEIARAKRYGCPVIFQRADAFDLGALPSARKMEERSTSPRPSPHLTPLPLSNAEREKRSPRPYEATHQLDCAAGAANHFTAGMAIHWWSHLRKSEIRKFLEGFHRMFRPGAVLVFMDNRYVEGSSTPISRTDGEGNTYQLRRLQDGTEHEVLKNFPEESEVAQILAGTAVEMRWTVLPYYWFLTYRLSQ